MSCENKLTNLVFKNKENSARTTMCFIFPSFLPPPFFLYIQNKKNTQNEMQCNSQRQKRKTQKQRNKEQWSQRKSNEAQGPCQKDSVSLSLLYPKLCRCTTSIGVCIHIKVISNSKIGIKVERLYQFTNKCYRILCLRHWHFWLICSLNSLQLVTIWTNVSRLPKK